MNFATMTEKEIIALMHLRFRRIGLNAFRAFIYEPDGKLNQMYEDVLDAETCTQISNISLDELRKMPIEKPQDVEPQIMVTMRGVLLIVLLAKNDETPKIVPAKKMLAERLAMRGMHDADLIALGGGAKIVGSTLVDRILNYLMGLSLETEKIHVFIDLAYKERWLDDAALQKWFTAVGGAR